MRRLLGSLAVVLALAVPWAVLADTTIFTDTFVENSGDKALPSHTPTPSGGGTWTESADTCTTTVIAFDTDDDAHPNATIADCRIVETIAPTTPLGSADYGVEAILSAGSALRASCLIGRWADASNFYTVCIHSDATNPDVLLRVNTTGGGNVSLGTSNSAPNNQTIQLRMIGSAISVYRNGVLIIGPITDTSLASAGVGGLGFGNLTGTATDDVNSNDSADTFALVDMTAATGAGRCLLLGVC